MNIKKLEQFIKESYDYMDELPDENLLGSLLSECESKTLKDFIEYLKTHNIEEINFRKCPWMKELQTSGLYFTNDEDTVADIVMFEEECDEADGLESELIVDNNDITAKIDTIVCFENSNYIIIHIVCNSKTTIWVAEVDK